MEKLRNYNSENNIRELLKSKVLILDGAMGTEIQKFDIPKNVWDKKTEGCNELLNITNPEIIKNIHKSYIEAGADIIKTNTFGTSPWTLKDYELQDEAYNLSLAGAKLAKETCREYPEKKDLFVAGTIGPGSRIPSFGDISYDEMYEGYKQVVKGLSDGGVDVFLLETCQDPLQIKVALHACQDVNSQIPIMVSVTIEENNSMLVGTGVETIANILDGFDVLSVGFNCGTGPKEVAKHIDKLSKLTKVPISIHTNAGIPINVGGKTVYPMEAKEFSSLEKDFLNKPNVGILGGCCGTTPEHIKELKNQTCNNISNCLSTEGFNPLNNNLAKNFNLLNNSRKLKHSVDLKDNNFVTSLFESVEFRKGEILLIGERCNASGSKIFKEIIENGDIEKAIEIAKSQISAGANIIDVNVAIPGLDEKSNMKKIIKEFRTKILLPLMIDSNSPETIEGALKLIGAKPIINSVSLEDGEGNLEIICKLAKKYNTSLVCLAIDEIGMAKTAERKVEIATRIYELVVDKYGLKPKDLIFDLLAFTVGTGQEEDKNVGKETLEAITKLIKKFPEVNTTLGLSNISHGLDKDARKVLNSVFLELAKKAGLTSAIVNAEHIIPIANIRKKDIEICENLLLNKTENALFDFIDHFSDFKIVEQSDEEFEKLSDKQKIYKLLKDANTRKLIELLEDVKNKISPNVIINEILIGAMKEIGELFGEGKIQMPFVLSSAETMNECVNYLNQFLEKTDNKSKARLVLGTVKGDVHDVGKNLTNIILTNNGYDVLDIGTRVEIEEFVKIINENKGTPNEITAIGFSGLLVKSTNVMLENLKYLESNNIDIPVLLGGAALNRKFVEEYCKPIYSGEVFYCKDAFDGIEAMKIIISPQTSTPGHPLLTFQVNSPCPLEEREYKVETRKNISKKKEYIIPDYENLDLPKKNEIPNVPFFGRKVLKIENIENLAFDWLNKKFLFSHSWGYTGKGLTKEEKENQKVDLEKNLEKYKKEIIEKDIFKPVIIYGYYPCKSDKDNLIIYNPENLDEILYTIKFPRHNKPPFYNLADYFRNDEFDILPLTIVSAGEEFSKYEKELLDNKQYLKYNEIHGISVNLAESLADILHKQIRKDLEILDKDKGQELTDVQRQRYHGARYSFGYNACPNLEDNKIIFDLLKPEEFGITLSETFQMHPEQTTSALIVHHDEAKYW